MDSKLIDSDPHFSEGCASCHRGDETAASRDNAHAGFVKRPSSDLRVCGKCHKEIADTYKNTLHFTTAGLRHGVSGRFSERERKIFDEKVFQRSCRSCHASCGDCHVASPKIAGVSTGLLKNHRFVAKDEGKTCGACHGGRVYPEFTGDFGGSADVHYQKGMTCLNCHTKTRLHGTGTTYRTKKEVKEKPACADCHKAGDEKTEKAKTAHTQHKDRVSCYACHSGGVYTNCYGCHLGKGATPKPGFALGLDPKDKRTVTTLRLVPAVRDTFKNAGIVMEKYDNLPNYWGSPVHNIRKSTERTRSCEACHVEKQDFLTREKLIENGSRANDLLLYNPKPIPAQK